MIKTFYPEAGGPTSLRSYEYTRLRKTVTTSGETQLEELPPMQLFHSVCRVDFSSHEPIATLSTILAY